MTSTLSPTGMKKLRDFKLSGMARTVPIRLEEAQSTPLSHQEFLELLLEDEASQRAENRRKNLYGSAHLPFEKGMEDFDFTFQPSVKKTEMLELATGNFISKRENVVFVGQPGTGKTHLSVALALSALGHGMSVLFTSVWDMITALEQSRADMSYHKKYHAMSNQTSWFWMNWATKAWQSQRSRISLRLCQSGMKKGPSS